MAKKKTPAPRRAGTTDKCRLSNDAQTEWLSLGERLEAAGPEKFLDTVARLREVVEAQEIIASYDHQLFLRGRPGKRYLA